MLNVIYLKVVFIMAQLDDLALAIAKAQSDFNDYKADVMTQFQGLKDQITALQNANPAVDLTGVLSAVATLDSSITGAKTEIDPPVVPPAP